MLRPSGQSDYPWGLPVEENFGQSCGFSSDFPKLYLCIALSCVGGNVGGDAGSATPGHLAVLPLPALATLAVRVWCLHIAPDPTCVNIGTQDLSDFVTTRLTVPTPDSL